MTAMHHLQIKRRKKSNSEHSLNTPLAWKGVLSITQRRFFLIMSVGPYYSILPLLKKVLLSATAMLLPQVQVMGSCNSVGMRHSASKVASLLAVWGGLQCPQADMLNPD